MTKKICNCCGQSISGSNIYWSYEFNKLTVDGVSIYLQNTEADLFEVLYSKIGNVVLFESIYTGLHGSFSNISEENNYLKNRVSMLNKKLKAVNFKIKNEYGIGYYLARTI